MPIHPTTAPTGASLRSAWYKLYRAAVFEARFGLFGRDPLRNASFGNRHVANAVCSCEVYVTSVLYSRGRRKLLMVRLTSATESFAFVALFLRAKSVATKHGLGNFSRGVVRRRMQ